jgi:hypothetical protein
VLAAALGAAVVSAAGVITVSEGGMTVAAAGAAAARAQCSEIMLNSVTAKLLSVEPEFTGAIAL